MKHPGITRGGDSTGAG
ncbi:hypothetical protein [Stutzerimonas stutzeri]